ncbi:MAG: hypothetical protein VB085_07215 [Peptococcaceae bacterium]|nr:hypothetical protein [Peptococcaceae bacterium]
MECNAVNCIYYRNGSCSRSAVALMEIAEELAAGLPEESREEGGNRETGRGLKNRQSDADKPSSGQNSGQSRFTLRDQRGCYSGALNLAGNCPDFRSD